MYYFTGLLLGIILLAQFFSAVTTMYNVIHLHVTKGDGARCCQRLSRAEAGAIGRVTLLLVLLVHSRLESSALLHGLRCQVHADHVSQFALTSIAA